MKIESLSIGHGVVREYEGRQVETAIFKAPVEGSVLLTALGFEGDQQMDRVHHGGPEKAVLFYAQAHYPHWEAFLGRPVAPAVTGENLTVSGMTEETVCIGDVYAVGEAVVQVAQPRVPCYKIGIRNGYPGMQNEVNRTGYSGWYVRVLTEGPVQAGDEIKLMRRLEQTMTVAAANRLMHHDKENLEGARQLLRIEGLAQVWQQVMQRRLNG